MPAVAHFARRASSVGHTRWNMNTQHTVPAYTACRANAFPRQPAARHFPPAVPLPSRWVRFSERLPPNNDGFTSAPLSWLKRALVVNLYKRLVCYGRMPIVRWLPGPHGCTDRERACRTA